MDSGKRVVDWTQQDIKIWIQATCSQEDALKAFINVSGFALFSGDQLAQLTEDQFLEIDSIFGRKLFQSLRRYKDNNHKSEFLEVRSGQNYTALRTTKFDLSPHTRLDPSQAVDASSLRSSIGPLFSTSAPQCSKWPSACASEPPTFREIPPASPSTMLSSLVISGAPGESLNGEIFQPNLNFQKPDDNLFSGAFNFDYICPVEIHNNTITPSLLDTNDHLSLNSTNRVLINLGLYSSSGTHANSRSGQADLDAYNIPGSVFIPLTLTELNVNLENSPVKTSLTEISSEFRRQDDAQNIQQSSNENYTSPKHEDAVIHQHADDSATSHEQKNFVQFMTRQVSTHSSCSSVPEIFTINYSEEMNSKLTQENSMETSHENVLPNANWINREGLSSAQLNSFNDIFPLELDIPASSETVIFTEPHQCSVMVSRSPITTNCKSMEYNLPSTSDCSMASSSNSEFVNGLATKQKDMDYTVPSAGDSTMVSSNKSEFVNRLATKQKFMDYTVPSASDSRVASSNHPEFLNWSNTSFQNSPHSPSSLLIGPSELSRSPSALSSNSMPSSLHANSPPRASDDSSSCSTSAPQSRTGFQSSSFVPPPSSVLLPTTLDALSPSASPEPSIDSLPESLSYLDTLTSASTSKPRTSSRRKRGRKLWEFLLDLLEDPECNPSIIRWEDRTDGVFRLMEQEVIAKKWGQRREKDNLSYDYFARALRYHYKSRMLLSVPERKLVYKFGPKILAEINK